MGGLKVVESSYGSKRLSFADAHVALSDGRLSNKNPKLEAVVEHSLAQVRADARQRVVDVGDTVGARAR